MKLINVWATINQTTIKQASFFLSQRLQWLIWENTEKTTEESYPAGIWTGWDSAGVLQILGDYSPFGQSLHCLVAW